MGVGYPPVRDNPLFVVEETMKRRIGFSLGYLLVVVGALSAASFGFSFGTLDSHPSGTMVSEGTHAQIGTLVGFGSRWEVEAFAGTQITPEPFSDLVGGAVLSFALLGPVHPHANGTEVPSYANMYAGLGFIGNFPEMDAYGPILRITPLSVGGPQFVMRERAGTLGVFYNIPMQSVTFFWNIFLVDFYL